MEQEPTKIGRRQFAEGMALLAERYNRELSPALSAVYLEAFVAAGLSGAEFVAGVKGCIIEREFFPSPAQIITAARPVADPKVEGAQVFTNLLAGAGGVATYHPVRGRVFDIERIAAVYGDAASRAVLAIGGPVVLANVSAIGEPFTRKDFAAAYADAMREQGARTTAAALGAGAQHRRVGPGPVKRGTLEPIGRLLPFSTQSGATSGSEDGAL